MTQGEILAASHRQVGARDTARDGHNQALRAALTEMIAELSTDAKNRPEVVICSGMITSNVGLREVPHILAPATVADLHDGMVRDLFAEITSLPFYFIPGVKTMDEGVGIRSLDVMRGEEAQCVGLHAYLGISEPVVFVSCGSHHKVIEVDAHGTILGSMTAPMGEILSAVADHTLIGDSLARIDTVPVERQWIREGIQLGLEYGFGRAMFLVRSGQLIGGLSETQVTNIFLGAILSQDIRMLEKRDAKSVVLYGHEPMIVPLCDDITERWSVPCHIIDQATADTATVMGAVRIFEYDGSKTDD